MNKIFLIDDQEMFYDIFKKIFEGQKYQISYSKTGKDALKKLEKEKYALILLDIQLPDLNGLELLKKIQKNNIDSEVIIITGYADIDDAVRAIKMGAYDYIEKPFDNQKLELTIKKAVSSYNLKQEVLKLKKQIDETLNLKEKMGESKQIKNVFRQIDLISQKNITVFLEGETGTGKDLVAKIIHEKSKRKDGPFIAVDCGAIPESLFESELFGHVKGAFTNATSNKKGKFEQADGGTLFLDEITNLPASLQSKFLRAIQEREIHRLGSSKSRKVDVRIIVATNKNIKEEIEDNSFRADLFYRLHEFKILLPNLRDRKADIPTILNYFLKKFNIELESEILGFTPEAMEKLINYPWYGNVRELQNVLKRAIISCNQNEIDVKHLKFISELDSNNSDDCVKNYLYHLDFKNSTLEEMLDKTEKHIIDEALNEAHGNKTQAAKKLDISRWSIYRKTNHGKGESSSN